MARAHIRLEDPPSVPLEIPAEQLPARRHWALNLLGVAIVLVGCYFAESVLMVILVSILLAFIVAPIVDALMYIRLPRAVGAFIAILLLLAALTGVFYYSYNQGAALMQDLPKYTARVRSELAGFRRQAETLAVLTPAHEKGVVDVRTTTDWTDVLTRGFGSVTEAVLAASFIPFLTFFMLTWQEHARSATVRLFPHRNRQAVYATLGLISSMIRTFMVGNLVIALLVGAIGTAVFGYLHLPFYYFAGFASGFLSLIPYMGILLAMVPPVFVGLGHLSSQDLGVILFTVLALHLIALNVLYPRLLGSRLALNPLAVTIGLLVWGGIWGAMGLVLALPITAAMKIVFDHVESLKPLGAWLGGTPNAA
jgi:predicted PurR-regulated permease PerM